MFNFIVFFFVLDNKIFRCFSFPTKMSCIRVNLATYCNSKRKRGCSGACMQVTLVAVLIVTLILNIIFIFDNSKIMRSGVKDEISPVKLPHDENKHVIFDHDSYLEEKNVGSDKNALSKKIKMEAKSSNEDVYISIDGLKVYQNNIKDDSSRGIHIVVINQFTGIVMASRIFDTYSSDKEDEAMILFLNMLQEGRIVIFMVKDEGSFQLKKSGRNAIKQYGSLLINNLAWRDMWVLISKKKNTWLAEAHEKSLSLDHHGSPVIAQAEVTLNSAEKVCRWNDDKTSRRRGKFCEKYEGYGSVCSCNNPAPINLKGPRLKKSFVKQIPIAVIAANRPHYLYRMLRGLLDTPGVDSKLVTVYIDGFFDEPSAVAELFNVNYVEHTPICSKNCRISQHYKRTLQGTFDKYANAEYMIILEEDLDVSKDLMDYFNQLIPVFNTDDSVYCLSAWNDQGYEYSCNDPALLYRVETMPGLGWVLKKKIFKEELEPNWPGSDKFWDWDMWMRLESNRKGRECIIPDVSRTYHFGAKGLNMNMFFQDHYFTKKALNRQTGILFDISKITKEGYESNLHQLINASEVLDHSKNPCSDENFIPKTSGHSYVFYIKYEHKTDYDTWYNVAKCFKLWDLDVRGLHKGMWRFWIRENMVFAVGTLSPYFIYKPKNINQIYMPKKEKETT